MGLGGLTRADFGTSKADQIFNLAPEHLDDAFVFRLESILIQKEFRCCRSLGNQHGETVGMWNFQLFRLLEQHGFKGVLDHVNDTAARGKL